MGGEAAAIAEDGEGGDVDGAEIELAQGLSVGAGAFGDNERGEVLLRGVILGHVGGHAVGDQAVADEDQPENAGDGHHDAYPGELEH